MTDWADEVDRLLFDGESVADAMDVGDDHLVVTTHRVLAFMPSGDGPNFEAIHRPNVTGVERQAGGNQAHLERAAKSGILGFFLLAGGATISLDGMLSGATVDSTAASQTGIADLLGFMGVLQAIMALVDDAMLVGGLLALALAALATTLYLRSRDTTVVVHVSGGDDLHLTGADVTDATLTRVERALGFARRDEGGFEFGDRSGV